MTVETSFSDLCGGGLDAENSTPDGTKIDNSYQLVGSVSVGFAATRSRRRQDGNMAGWNGRTDSDGKEHWEGWALRQPPRSSHKHDLVIVGSWCRADGQKTGQLAHR